MPVISSPLEELNSLDDIFYIPNPKNTLTKLEYDLEKNSKRLVKEE